MRDLELAHGRTAMMGLTSWVLFEAVTGVPITSAAAIFFKPFWAWGLPFLGENGFIGTLEFAAIVGALGYKAYDVVANDWDSIKYVESPTPNPTLNSGMSSRATPCGRFHAAALN